MGKSIQQLRKDAGFRTAREFAKACGFTPSSLARYEKEPDNVPVKSAWKMADVLGCTIDDVVGRDNPVTADMRGDVQIRFEALPSPMRSNLEDYLDYLEARAQDAKETAERRKCDRYARAARRYIVAFFEQRYPKDAILDAHADPDAVRNQFEGYLAEQLGDSELGEDERKEVVEELMAAYDAFERGEV